MSTVWLSAASRWPSGNTVMTPPTSRSSTFTGSPCSFTTRDPLRHLVTNSELPGTRPERRDREERGEPERAGGGAEHAGDELAPLDAFVVLGAACGIDVVDRVEVAGEGVDVVGARLERLAVFGERTLGEELARA